jgi:hypothetical protein
MDIRPRRIAWLMTVSAMLLGCGDQPPPIEPDLAPPGGAAALMDSRPAATPAPVTDADAPQLSAGVRAAMARALTAALTEFDLDPAVSMSLLHDFMQHVEAHQVDRPDAGVGPAATMAS